MKNAHLRFGWLTYVKSTEKTTTSIKLRLDCFIGEVLPDPPRQAKAHLISVIGGDTQISAVSAAISMGDRFMAVGKGQMFSRSGYVWSGMPSASRAPSSLPGERSRCVTSLACRKSLLQAMRLHVQEERCWQDQTADLFGPPSLTFTGYRESRNGRTGLRMNWIRITL